MLSRHNCNAHHKIFLLLLFTMKFYSNIMYFIEKENFCKFKITNKFKRIKNISLNN